MKKLTQGVCSPTDCLRLLKPEVLMNSELVKSTSKLRSQRRRPKVAWPSLVCVDVLCARFESVGVCIYIVTMM